MSRSRYGLLPEDDDEDSGNSFEVSPQAGAWSWSGLNSFPVASNYLGSWEQVDEDDDEVEQADKFEDDSQEPIEVASLPIIEPMDLSDDMDLEDQYSVEQDQNLANDLPMLDLNQLFITKCRGSRPWRGSVLCNLGEGGALGQFVASLRLTRGQDGYNSNGVVVAVLLAFEGIQRLLTAQPGDPWYSRLLMSIARRVPATQAFLRVYERLATAVANNEHVEWSDFDELTEYAVRLMQVPIIRNALRVYMTDELNIAVLDLGAEQSVERRGWMDRILGWVFNKLGIVKAAPQYQDVEQEPEAEPEYFDAEDGEVSYAVNPY